MHALLYIRAAPAKYHTGHRTNGMLTVAYALMRQPPVAQALMSRLLYTSLREHVII